MNVFNPDAKTVRFDKRLAVSYPPVKQMQGETYKFGFDSLDPLHALKTDCDDLIDKAFNGVPPQPYFEGFVVITSPVSLDVTAVYTGSGTSAEAKANQSGSGDITGGRCFGRSCGCGCCGCGHDDDGDGKSADALTIDVEQIRERVVKAPPGDGDGSPDLVPRRPFEGDGSGAPNSGYCMALASGPGAAERFAS